MAYPTPLQVRAVDPYSSYQSNNVNKISRIVSGGENGILAPNPIEVLIADQTHLDITAGDCLKDDVFVSIDTIQIDFEDPAHYLDDSGGIWNVNGYYYVCLKYTYVKSKPAPEASIVILLPSQKPLLLSNSSLLLLKIAEVLDPGSIRQIVALYNEEPGDSSTSVNTLGSGIAGTAINKLSDIGDVPDYAGNALKHLRINLSETATEWADPPDINVIANKYTHLVTALEDPYTTINITGWTYTPGDGNISVYVNGVRQTPPDPANGTVGAYTETSGSVVTLSEAVSEGAEILVLSMDDSTGANFSGVYSEFKELSIPTQTNIGPFAFAYVTGHIDLYIDGVRQIPGAAYAFTEVDEHNIEMTEPLDGGQEIYVVALTGTAGGSGGDGGSYIRYERFLSAQGQSAFVLADPFVAGQIAVYINGVRQSKEAYLETGGNTIIFSEGLDLDDEVLVYSSYDSVVTQIVNKYTAIAGTDCGTGADVQVDLPWTYISGQLAVYIDGVRQSETSFAEIDNNTVEINDITLVNGNELFFVSLDDDIGASISSQWELDGNGDVMPIA